MPNEIASLHLFQHLEPESQFADQASRYHVKQLQVGSGKHQLAVLHPIYGISMPLYNLQGAFRRRLRRPV